LSFFRAFAESSNLSKHVGYFVVIVSLASESNYVSSYEHTRVYALTPVLRMGVESLSRGRTNSRDTWVYIERRTQDWYWEWNERFKINLLGRYASVI
jgi:hypothetical protein